MEFSEEEKTKLLGYINKINIPKYAGKINMIKNHITNNTFLTRKDEFVKQDVYLFLDIYMKTKKSSILKSILQLIQSKHPTIIDKAIADYKIIHKTSTNANFSNIRANTAVESLTDKLGKVKLSAATPAVAAPAPVPAVAAPAPVPAVAVPATVQAVAVPAPPIFPVEGPLKNPRNMRNTFRTNITRRVIPEGYATRNEGITAVKSRIQRATMNMEEKQTQLNSLTENMEKLTETVDSKFGQKGIKKLRENLKTLKQSVKHKQEETNGAIKTFTRLAQNRELINRIGTIQNTARNVIEPWKRKQEENARLILEDKQMIDEGRKRPDGPEGEWKGQLELYYPWKPEAIKGNLTAKVLEFKQYAKEFIESQKPIDLALTGKVYNVDRDTTMYEFIRKLFLNPKITIDEIVSFYFVENRPVTGCDSYEVLCRLFLFLGGMNGVDPKEDGDYRFVDRIDIRREKNQNYLIYKTNTEALKETTCVATSKSGVSDITLIHKDAFSKTILINKPKVYLMSVKWFGEEQSADKKYDIEALLTQRDRTITIESRKNLDVNTIQHLTNNDIDIIVFLKNRGAFAKKCGNAVSTRNTQNVCEQIFGWVEDVQPFLDYARNEIFVLADSKNKLPMTIFNELYNIH